MSEPINLNRARKAKARVAADNQAARNRVAFGRTKADKDLAKAKADLARKALDAGKRES